MVRVLLFLLFSSLFAQPTQDLYLEAFLEKSGGWYPGEEGSVTYRIWYKGEIALIKENLPLLDISGLDKVGDKVFYEYNEEPFSIQEVTQRYRAVRAGTFTVGPSSLQGVRYKIEEGEKKLIPPVLKTETPSYTVTIAAFPEEGKPADFNGSIGKGSFRLVEPTSKKGRIGDWITFSIIANDFDKESLLVPPNLNCLPGFAGFFTQNPQVDSNNGTFTFKIMPQNSLPTEIPPILWTVFDPDDKTYHTFKTPPIPIEIAPFIPTIESHLLDLSHLQRNVKPAPPQLAPVEKSEPFRIPWFYLHGALLATILGYLLLRKPIKKYYLLYRLEPLRRAEREVCKEGDPLKVAQVMQGLLAQALRQKGAKAPVKTRADATNFMAQLEAFRFAKGESLTKETIVEKSRSLYRALAFCLLLLPHFLYSDTLNSTLEDLLKSPPTEQNTVTLATVLEELDEKPLALYYLQRGAEAHPYSKEIAQKTEQLEQELGVMHVPSSAYSFLTPPVVKGSSFILALIGFCFIIKRKRNLGLSLLAASYAILILFYTIPYFMPHSGLILEPTYLFTDASQKTHASDIPLLPGDSVEIVGSDKENFYIFSYPLKTYGYVSQKSLRPLE